MEEWAARVEAVLPGAIVGRVGRTSIELGFQAEDDAAATARITEALAEVERPIEHAGMRMRFGAAAGLTPVTGGVVDDAAIDRATAAAAAAHHSVSRICFRPAAPGPHAESEFHVAQALYEAVERDEVSLHYQPKMHCRSDSIVAIEALTRFSSRALQQVPVDRAFLVAERVGAIGVLTDWLIEQAIADRLILSAATTAPRIDINLSGRLLSDSRYVERLAVRLAGTDIGVEITETAVLIDPVEAIRNVQRLVEAGVRVAIDDYGSGLSSLAYLKQLPAHELKIDRMFIQGLTTSHRDPLLVRSTIDLAHALEMEVTAEGVDDPLSLSLLRVMGCDQVQGFLIARPMPRAALTSWLADPANYAGMGASVVDLPVPDAKQA